jgi:hypothetical protein
MLVGIRQLLTLIFLSVFKGIKTKAGRLKFSFREFTWIHSLGISGNDEETRSIRGHNQGTTTKLV